MGADLHGNAIEVFWTGTSYLLSSTVFLLPLGALSHIFGRTPVLIFCTICFLVGIIVSGFASNYTIMLLGRTIQGVGGGGIILLNDIIMTDLVPMRLRGTYSGVIGGVWALGSVSGPVIGGALAYKANWVSHISHPQRGRAGDRCSAPAIHHILTKIGVLEMDFLDQYSIRCDFPDHGTDLSTTECDPRLDQAKTSACRLARQCHTNMFHDQFPHSCHLGWRPISLELVADAGPIDTWSIWDRGFLLVRAMYGGRANHPS